MADFHSLLAELPPPSLFGKSADAVRILSKIITPDNPSSEIEESGVSLPFKQPTPALPPKTINTPPVYQPKQPPTASLPTLPKQTFPTLPKRALQPLPKQSLPPSRKNKSSSMKNTNDNSTSRSRCTFSSTGSCKISNCRSPHIKTSTTVCRYFKSGQCTADSCAFSHDLSKEACVFFHLHNRCTNGASCKFSHEEITKEQREQLDVNRGRYEKKEEKKEEANRIAEEVPVEFVMPESFGNDYGDLGGDGKKAEEIGAGDQLSAGPFNLPKPVIEEDLL